MLLLKNDKSYNRYTYIDIIIIINSKVELPVFRDTKFFAKFFATHLRHKVPATHLRPIRDTLVCRNTPVNNLCSKITLIFSEIFQAFQKK